MDLTLAGVIDDLILKKDLTAAQSSFAMGEILNGRADPVQISAVITLLRAKGETPVELSNIVKTMWENIPSVGDVDVSEAIDNCGTGGDNSGTINISTAASIVLAACDIKVAKHGNIAVSSKSGAANVLDELGIPTTLSPEEDIELFSKTNYCFLFAPTFHPGMKHAAPIRAALGVRTTFNFLGPLANPFQVPYRLHGVSDPALVAVYAETLKELGVKRAYVFNGFGSIDELSLSGINKGYFLSDGEISQLNLDPKDYGFNHSELEDIKGGDAKHNASIIRDVLSGGIDGPYLDSIVFNAAVAMHVVKNISIDAAVEKILESVSSGQALKKMSEISDISQKIVEQRK